MRAQPLDDQPLGSAVRFGHQIVLALQFKPDAPLEKLRQQRSGFARDLRADL